MTPRPAAGGALIHGLRRATGLKARGIGPEYFARLSSCAFQSGFAAPVQFQRRGETNSRHRIVKHPQPSKFCRTRRERREFGTRSIPALRFTLIQPLDNPLRMPREALGKCREQFRRELLCRRRADHEAVREIGVLTSPPDSPHSKVARTTHCTSDFFSFSAYNYSGSKSLKRY